MIFMFMSDALGGDKACRLIKGRIMSVYQFRNISAPAKPDDIMRLVSLPAAYIQETLGEREATSGSRKQGHYQDLTAIRLTWVSFCFGLYVCARYLPRRQACRDPPVPGSGQP